MNKNVLKGIFVASSILALSGCNKTKTADDVVATSTPTVTASADIIVETPSATNETTITRNDPTDISSSANPNLDEAKVAEAGTAGLLSMKDNQVFTLNWSEDGTSNATTGDAIAVYKVDSGMLVIKPLFAWNSEAGETMELTDETGKVETYVCVETHIVQITGTGNYIFSDDNGTEAEATDLGQVVIISNGQASYWYVQ